MLPTLDDAQQVAILNAMRPLGPHEREAFLSALTHLLSGKPEIGPGELHRTLVDLQRECFAYPLLAHSTHVTPTRGRADNSALKELAKKQQA
jgi:hypothetical protein